jgi:hypothetical protein
MRLANPPALFKTNLFVTTAPQGAYKIAAPRMTDASKKRKKKMSETHPPQPDARQFERLAAFLRLLPEDGPLDRLLKGAAHLEPQLGTPAELASDILHGAGQIAHFLYGDAKYRRRVYRLVQADRLPHFRLGSSLCCRKSTLDRFLTAEERVDAPSPTKRR